MRSVAARTSAIPAVVRSGATSPFCCSNCPAAISSGSIQGAASFIAFLLMIADIILCRCGWRADTTRILAAFVGDEVEFAASDRHRGEIIDEAHVTKKTNATPS